MSPLAFVEKWRAVTTSERATAQSHFNDLCALLGEPTPHEDDPTGERYAFEKGAAKTGGGDGWADVWRQGCFAWEYKGPHKNLDKALAQVKNYAAALLNPPLLVACDIHRIVVVTNWTNTVSVRTEITLDDLLIPAKREFLKKVFQGDEALRTGESRAALTAMVAHEFAALARELELAGHDPLRAAHFVNRLVFCLFAEDAGLLGDGLLSKVVEIGHREPDRFVPLAKSLFDAMSTGGALGLDDVAWFNGGLFEDGEALPLTRPQIRRIRDAAVLDWTAIDPSILGTLFERGLDPAKRSQLGAHYTDPENIMRIVEPVVLRPLAAEWGAARAAIEGAKGTPKKRELLAAYLARLRGTTILDPACGSGNFLYLALRSVKDLEHRVLLEAEALGLGRAFPEIGPEILRGIELSPYAAELARVSIWIGQLQWQLEHGYNVDRDPILKPLDTIQNRDALLNADGTEAAWPEAEFIIGNPPFIGDKKMREELGDAYTETLRRTYKGRVPGGADLVAYWFDKSGEALREKTTRAVGLVSTNGIRKGRNNAVLRRALAPDHRVSSAWADLPWHDERGAQVRVSIVVLSPPGPGLPELNGVSVSAILPDLTARTEGGPGDLGLAKALVANDRRSFNGLNLAGKFDVPEASAREWLATPNPTGRPSSDVLRPIWNGRDIAQKWSGRWVIDLGTAPDLKASAGYEGPFAWLDTQVKPIRALNRDRDRREKWWKLGRPRPEMRGATAGMTRVLVTPETSKHRYFRWLPVPVAPDHSLIVIATDEDETFGILSSRFHLIWAAAQGNRLGVGNDLRYNSTRTFLTFPFPDPAEAVRAEIAEAARELDQLREKWLNPPEWTREETLAFPATIGGPWHRHIPDADALEPGTVAEARYVRRVADKGYEKSLAARTLTKLYNEPPAWLRNAHARLDLAVAEAYGLPADAEAPAVLAHLLALNLAASGSAE